MFIYLFILLVTFIIVTLAAYHSYIYIIYCFTDNLLGCLMGAGDATAQMIEKRKICSIKELDLKRTGLF